MATETTTDGVSYETAVAADASLRYGASLMALSFAGLGAVGAVLVVQIQGGQGAIESGVDFGMTTAELAAVNPALPDYIAHVRMAAAGMFVALGVLGVTVSWYGVRRGQRWAWAAAVVALLVGVAVGVPMHYAGSFHVDQVRHLGPSYLALGVFAVGALLSYRGLERGLTGESP